LPLFGSIHDPCGTNSFKRKVIPDVALPKPGKATSKTLQLRIIRELGVTEEFTLGEVLISYGNGCSQLLKVPLQCFGKIPAALCGGFPARPPSTLARFLQVFFATGGS